METIGPKIGEGLVASRKKKHRPMVGKRYQTDRTGPFLILHGRDTTLQGLGSAIRKE